MRYGEYTLADKTGRPVLRAFLSTVPRGRREYREHHHAECELSTILSGSGTYTVRGREYTFRAGDVFLFSGDEVHCLTDISDGFVLLNTQFSPQLLWSERDAYPALAILFSRNEKFENRIDPADPHTPALHDGIAALYREMEEGRTGWRLMARYRLFSLLLTLVREYDYVDTHADYSYLRHTVRPMRAALDYIDGNLDRPLTLPEISACASMTPTYFSALFRQMNGLPLWEYITIKRVERAIGLLRDTDLTKLDIAGMCGFSSPSNFYRAFAQVTGKTPSHYTGRRTEDGGASEAKT